MLGVQAPVAFWGPAGFTADCSSEDSARRRQTEIRHGCVAMFAAMSCICQILLQAAGLPVFVRWPDVRACAEHPGRHLQGAGFGLGSEPAYMASAGASAS
eukprot:2128379-Heterocapsa_arctica.AAC.1